jgi:tetratricopeptide (TPR) repeat protein
MNDSLNSLPLVDQAKAAYQDEEFEKAAELFAQVEKGALASGDALDAAEMANNRSVALLKAGQAEQALQAAQGTDAIFAQAGDIRRQAIALGNQAAALEGLKRYDDAMTLYKQCAELLKSTDDKELRTYVLQSMSALQLRRGKQFEAMVSMEAALDAKQKLSVKDRFLKKLLQTVSKLLNR